MRAHLELAKRNQQKTIEILLSSPKPFQRRKVFLYIDQILEEKGKISRLLIERIKDLVVLFPLARPP